MEMTERKVNLALSKIKLARDSGYGHEALIRQYLLNLALLRFIVGRLSQDETIQNKKLSTLVNQFCDEVRQDEQFRIIIHPRTLKSILPWARSMNAYFKGLKQGVLHKSTADLFQASQSIFTLLHISSSKLFIADKKQAVKKGIPVKRNRNSA